jgi:Na+-translocating ferredoxin:NAD+ oxidoreductase RnfG subunit
VKANRIKKLYPILLITLVMVISVSLLVTLESITRAVLEARQEQATLELLQGIFPEANFYIYDEGAEIYTLYNNGRNKVGYAFYGKGWGYRWGLVVLIGLEDKETIRGIVVTSHYETWSYWEMLEKNNFFDQFNGLKIEDCILKHPSGIGGEVDGVTKATYSCRGVTNIVRETSLEKIEYLN